MPVGFTPQFFLLGDQPAEVTRRTLIARRAGDRQQPLRRDPAIGRGYPCGHQVGERVEVSWPWLPRWRPACLSPLDHPLDRLVSGAAQLGRAAIRPDLVIRRNDVHT